MAKPGDPGGGVCVCDLGSEVCRKDVMKAYEV